MESIGLPADLVEAVSTDNIVNEIVIPDTGSPLMQRVTFLESDVIDGEGDKLFFRYLLGIFVIFVHGDTPLKILPVISIIKRKNGVCNIFTYNLYIFGYTIREE